MLRNHAETAEALSDQKKQSSRGNVYAVHTPGALGLVLQVVVVYTTAAYLRDGPEWVGPEYTAVCQTLHLDSWPVKLPGKLIRSVPQLCRLVTFLTMVVEGYGAWLLVIPFGRFTPHLRMAGVVLLLVFMVGLGTSLGWLGIIPEIYSAALLGLLPAMWWDRWAGKLFSMTLGARRVAGASAFALDRLRAHEDWRQRSRPASASHRSPNRLVSSISRELQCHFHMLAGICTLVMMWSYASLLGWAPLMPGWLSRMVEAANMDQHWSMFDNCCEWYDSWVSIVGTLEDGRTVALDNPADPQMQATFGWGPGLNSGTAREYADVMDDDGEELLAGYICRQWKEAHASVLASSFEAFRGGGKKRAKKRDRRHGKEKQLSSAGLRYFEIQKVADLLTPAENHWEVRKKGPAVTSRRGFRCKNRTGPKKTRAIEVQLSEDDDE